MPNSPTLMARFIAPKISWNVAIGRTLEQLRDEQAMPVAVLARATGVSRTTMYFTLRGGRNITVGDLHSASRALGASASEVFVRASELRDSPAQ